MKVLLSWLRDFAPFEGDPVALGEEMSDLGMAGRGAGADRRGPRRHRRRPGARDCARIEGANKIQLVIVDAGDGEPLEVGCGAFNMSAGDLVPLATVGTVMPNGMEIGRRKMAGRRGRTGCSAPPRELGLGDDHEGIFLLPDGPRARARRSPRRWASSPTSSTTSRSTRTGPTPCRWPAWPATWRRGSRLPFTLPDPKPATVPADRVGGVTVEILDPDRCGRFEARVLRGVTVGPGDPKLASRLALLGHALDQQRRRRVELRDARARPAEPPLRPGQGARAAASGCGVARDGRDAHHPRRRRAPPHARRPPHLRRRRRRRSASAGSWAAPSSEIDDATTDVLLEMAWFHPIGIVKSSRRHKLRSEAQRPLREGLRPRGRRPGHAPLRRAARRAARGRRRGRHRHAARARRRCGCAPAGSTRLLGTELSTERIAELLDPIGFTTTPAGDDLDVDDPVVALRLRDRDRRHRGDRPPPRLHRPSAARSRAPPTRRSLSPRQAERRRLRSLLVGRGLTEAMPMPFLAPGELARVRPARRRHHDRQPARGRAVGAPHGAAARAGRCGRLQLVAPQPRRPPLRDRPHLQPAVVAGRRPPRRARVPRCRAGRVRGARGGAPVAVRLRGARRRRAPASRTARCPGFHPTRAARILVGDVRGRRGRRDRSRACSRPTASASGSPTSRSTSTRCSTCPHGDRIFRPFSLFPSSDIDLAFEVDDDVPASAVEDAIRAAGGELLVERPPVRRLPRHGRRRRHAAASPTPSASRPPTAPSPTPTSPTVRQQIIDAVQSQLPATLRG